MLCQNVGPKDASIDPVAIARGIIPEQRVDFSQRSEMVGICPGRGKPGRVVDDGPTQLSLSMESRPQPQQHLIFRNLDAPLGYEFLCTRKDAGIDDWSDSCETSNPPLLRIAHLLLSKGSGSAVVNDIADVVLIQKNDADHGAGPWSPLIGDLRPIEFPGDLTVRFSLDDKLMEYPSDGGGLLVRSGLKPHTVRLQGLALPLG